MVKDTQTVIQHVFFHFVDHNTLNYPKTSTNAGHLRLGKFNHLVNKSASDLEAWLKGELSESAGWSKSDESGDLIRHERIIEILKKNPSKDPEQYKEDDVEHMRRLVAYYKRHMAQELD
ncbi:hypothetical protein CHU98_g2697 [Xylaria longipes]|nr:hypothetical protein CHU98_g2697 [Xylaria longipes]